MHDLVYLTSDMGSAHQRKRTEWFSANGVSGILRGFGAERNQQGASGQVSYTVVKTRFLFIRFGIAFYCLIRAWEDLSKKLVVVRGFEFEFLCMLFRLSYIVEYSDINPRQKKGTLLFALQKKIFSCARAVLFTSPAFAEYFDMKTDFAIWHNSRLSGSLNCDTSLFSSRKSAVVYCGYIRNFQQIESISKSMPVDVYGVFNILGCSAKEFAESIGDSVTLGGEYAYHEVFQIYERYRFAYVGDHLHFNSQYNLTNRLYESLQGGALPFTVRNEAFLARFMCQHGIGIVLDNYGDLTDLATLSDKEWHDIVLHSRKRIIELVRRDDENVIAMLTC